MLESVIKGYKINEHRNPELKQEIQSTGEIIGSAIYLYFKPLTYLCQYVKSYKSKN